MIFLRVEVMCRRLGDESCKDFDRESLVFVLPSVVTQNRPMRVTSKPANEKARGIDSDGSPFRLLRYEQCLERSEETTSFGTREARMALAAHRASHWCTSRNSRRLPEGGGDRGTTTGWLGTASTGKTGQRGDHRPR